MPLYETVARDLLELIEHGTFRPGDRLPSVRELSRKRRVSLTTAVQAYRLLETGGHIRARPQSGFFVRSNADPALALPERSEPPRDPCQVTTGELIGMVLRDSNDSSVVSLAAALPDLSLLPTEKLTRLQGSIARRLGRRAFGYDFPPGCPELRKQIARRALETGYGLTPDQVVTTVGCQEAFTLALLATTKRGDAVAIESPAFYGFLQTLEALGLDAIELPCEPATGVCPGALARVLERRRVGAVVVSSSFNNPLGSCVPEEHRRELALLAARYETPLIEDDIYGDLAHDGERPGVIKAHDRSGLVLLCSSFSKTLAPGWRVGWIAPGRFQQRIEELKVVSTIATPTLQQVALAEFLEGGAYDRYLARVRSVYARSTASMRAAVLRAFPRATRVTSPRGGFVLWVELPEERSALTLYARARRAGIAVAPGPIFSARGGYASFVRLNAARWDTQVERAIGKLGRLADEIAPGSASPSRRRAAR